MSLSIQCLDVDAADPQSLASFWAEVLRLAGLGATRADVGQGDERSWGVMRDPEGNEFCVLRAYTAEERARVEALRNAATDSR